MTTATTTPAGVVYDNTTVPPPSTGSATVADLVATHPTATLAAVAAVAVILVAVTSATVRHYRHLARHTATAADPATPPPSASIRIEDILTILAAAVATAAALQGMYTVMTRSVGLDGPTAVGLATFLELGLIAEAARARRHAIRYGTVGTDGVAVWVIAAVSALISAAEAQGLTRAIRLAAPLLAAWFWERGLAAHRREAKVRPAIAWRWTRERAAVWLRLAEPSHRDTVEVDRHRRTARLTRAWLRLAVLDSPAPVWVQAVTARPVRRAVAVWRLQRQGLAAVEHLGLGDDPAVAATIRATVAAVVGLPAATAPATLVDVSPWGPPPVAAIGPPPSATATPPPSATATPPLADPPPSATATPPDDPSISHRRPPLALVTPPPSATATPPLADPATPPPSLAEASKPGQDAWFARHLPAHPRRTTDEWVAVTGLSRRTVERRLRDARAATRQATG